jgi:hypothetical protein
VNSCVGNLGGLENSGLAIQMAERTAQITDTQSNSVSIASTDFTQEEKRLEPTEEFTEPQNKRFISPRIFARNQLTINPVNHE